MKTATTTAEVWIWTASNNAVRCIYVRDDNTGFIDRDRCRDFSESRQIEEYLLRGRTVSSRFISRPGQGVAPAWADQCNPG